MLLQLETEILVASLLEQQPGVVTVIQSELNGPEDKRGIDLTVFLDPEIHGVDIVTIQVKSRREEIQRFRKKLSKREGIEREHVADWLRANKFIVLNGRLASALLLERFNNGLRSIVQYEQESVKEIQIFP